MYLYSSSDGYLFRAGKYPSVNLNKNYVRFQFLFLNLIRHKSQTISNYKRNSITISCANYIYY